MNTSLIFLADGFEEVEGLTPADVLRRAEMPVTLVSLNPTTEVVGAHGIHVLADTTISALQSAPAYEWVICPGGMPGAQNLANSERVNTILRTQANAGGKIAAICAAPGVVLAPLGLLDGKTATCYPGFQQFFPESAKFTGSPVEADGLLVTANGPAAALQFALRLVAISQGAPAAQALAAAMMQP